MTSEMTVNANLEEKINYPDRRWPHVILHTTLNKTLLGYIPLHWHYALQFMYVTDGIIQVKLAENTLAIHEGEGLFINSNVVHEIHDVEEGARFYCWNIGLPNVTEYINFTYVSHIVDQAQSIPFIKLSPNDEESIHLLKRIEKVGQIYIAQKGYFQLQILSEFYQCLNHLLNIFDQYQQVTQYFFDPRVKQCIQFLQSHYYKKVKLSELSRMVHMSEAETIKLFKRFAGDTPLNFLQNYRLEQSAKQLMYHHRNVTEVAMDCGFSTTSYFIQSFKHKYSLTPKQFQIKYAKHLK
ncbi:AraC family transcriptional regulator [Staphylococcus borealis]|uniref:AraC family transcriptional regulator n=1 Tax=Staphylococcus borealis TaxID=2742203 RepID=UPI002A838E04|nr:AraC family transcriptional regulator [Staphylococcus borealis]MDY4023018.1 AraC family transcriptional regulator [Staphylococcus borealis]